MSKKPYNYVDKNGEKIKAGMTISIDGQGPELVYDCMTQDEQEDLGINASNVAYIRLHPEAEQEFYSLKNFPADTIEIVSRGYASSGLKNLRKEKGLTLQGLAEKSGVNYMKIHQIETGKINPLNITLKTALKLADALGCRPRDILIGPEATSEEGGGRP